MKKKLIVFVLAANLLLVGCSDNDDGAIASSNLKLGWGERYNSRF